MDLERFRDLMLEEREQRKAVQRTRRLIGDYDGAPQRKRPAKGRRPEEGHDARADRA